MYDIIELNAKKVPELKEIAKKLGVARAEKLKKQDLVYSILDEQALQPAAAKKSPAKSKKDGDANKRTRNTVVLLRTISEQILLRKTNTSE